MLYFEWDEAKAAANKKKHGISFEAASSALEDLFVHEELDDSSASEQRLISVGMATFPVVLLVVHTPRKPLSEVDEVTRIISARRASPGERRDYEQHRAQSGGHPIE